MYTILCSFLEYCANLLFIMKTFLVILFLCLNSFAQTVIKLPPGRTVIDKPIYVESSNVTILGENSTLKLSDHTGEAVSCSKPSDDATQRQAASASSSARCRRHAAAAHCHCLRPCSRGFRGHSR